MQTNVNGRRLKRGGIPTTHNHANMRSLLEARWGSFFDLINWKWIYEPFEFSGWIPDFLLLGHTKILVEIKPIVDFDESVAERIITAAREANWSGEILILGASPMPIPPHHHQLHNSKYGNSVGLGWLASIEDLENDNNKFPWKYAQMFPLPYFSTKEGTSNYEWIKTYGNEVFSRDRPIIDFIDPIICYHFRMTGIYAGTNHLKPPPPYPAGYDMWSFTQYLWRLAGNEHQWKPKR